MDAMNTSPPPARLRLSRAALFAALAAALLLTSACRGGTGESPPTGLTTATAALSTPAASPTQGLTAELPVLTTDPPWPAPANAAERAAAAGLTALGTELLDYHVHAHLDVIVDGQAVLVPEGIGIDVGRQLISPLHTHDPSGIIHIEAAQPQRFTLGQFFVEWGVRLDDGCVGGYCDSSQRPVRFYVNGTPFLDDPRGIELVDQAEIAIVIGSQSDVPDQYDFPAGL
jgi:hypothetical protein